MFPFRYGRRNFMEIRGPLVAPVAAACGGVVAVCRPPCRVVGLGGGGVFVSRELHSGRMRLCVTSPRPISTGRLRALLPSTSGLSTQSSSGGLTRLTRWETSS